VLAGRGGNGEGSGSWVRGPKMGHLILSMGPAMVDVDSHVQCATIPSKRVIYTLNICECRECKKSKEKNRKEIIICVSFVR
jgi:hypothetical protein